MVMNIKFMAFQDETAYSLVDTSQCFGGTSCLLSGYINAVCAVPACQTT